MATPTRSRSHPVALAGLAAVSAATTVVSLLTWQQFTEGFSRTLWPLVVLAVAIAGSGALARWWRVPRLLTVLAQLVLTAMLVSVFVCGSPIPVSGAWDELVAAYTDAVETANQFAPPVPTAAPPVHPLLIAGGAACLLLVDVLACTVRRVPLAGLPLLTIFSVPVSMTGDGPHWLLYVVTAVGFLVMIFLSESEQVARWGPILVEDHAGGAQPKSAQLRTWPRTGARAIGGVATALSIVVPLALPSFSVHLFDFGPGAGGDDDINIDNPMADLQRDLVRGPDVPLVRISTDDPDPSYLRIAVLNRFRDNEWSSGNREVPSNQVAEGQMPGLVGVASALQRTEYSYSFEATEDFSSTWLPTPQLVDRVDAPGDWRYDVSTMDFLASEDDLDTSLLDWQVTGVELDYDVNRLATAPPVGALVSRDFTDLPADLDPIVRDLSTSVTANAASRFEKAVALQRWFREAGGFVYDDEVNLGNGTDDLVQFLSQGSGGRRGYCEQFAAAMAVMARQLGIPARVAVGFLHPDELRDGVFEYSAHDLHAWPELFFPGSGWVRFEPTPGDRADDVPGYTTARIDLGDDTASPSASASTQGSVPQRESAPVDPLDQQADEDAATSSGGGFPWLPVLGGVLLLAVLALLAVGPRTIRQRRREARGELGPEEAWAELRDTAVDLRLAWPHSRSPRQTRDALVQLFGAPHDEFSPERPRRGPDTNPDAVEALDLIVGALERLRYARGDGTAPGTWRAEMQQCVEALNGGAPKRARRAAQWWPRSVFRGRVTLQRPPEPTVAEVSAGRLVDHVG